MPSSTFIKQPKHPSQMSLDELREAANHEAIGYYRGRAEANPNDETAQREYQDFCLLQGLDPSTGRKSRFASMSRAQIGQEWEAAGRKVEAQNLDEWRMKNAETWMASQPSYAATPENAAKLVAELESRGLRGSVMELQNVFDYLVKHGEIQPKPQPPAPVELLTTEEFSNMSAAEMKAYIESAGRKGIL